MSASPLDPTFRDDLPAPEAYDIRLFLPEPIARTPGRSIWIDQRTVFEEDLFDDRLVHPGPRRRTYVLRRSEAGRGVQWLDSAGKPVEHVPDLLHDIAFPPRVWMSDSAMERSMMFHAARLARGDVLVGGLGLAIYPQFVRYLARPVTSITVVDNNPDILRLIGEPWVKSVGSGAPPITLVEATIESFLSSGGTHTYDTIYLDTWGDLHWRFLAAINHLVWLSESRLREGGQIQAWGLWHIRRALVAMAVELERAPEHWTTLDTSQSPVLDEYMRWRKAQPEGPLTAQEVEAKAGEMARTIRKPGSTELYLDPPRFGRFRTVPL
ncbi:MAG: hypothetical protein IPK82_35165 [Polyangiaceae bacterium]|nr:hypothetical protein [Polyangiaceae bacterium]